MREGKEVNEAKLVENLLDSFNKKITLSIDPSVKKLKKDIEKFEDPKDQNLLLKRITKLFPSSLKNMSKELAENIRAIVNDKEKNFTKKKKDIISIIEFYVGSEKTKQLRVFEKIMREETLTPLLTAIRQSIKKEEDSLYLPYITEQVISSFFVAKFNTQADIREFMKNLEDSIVNKANLPKEDNYLSAKDLESIANKGKAYELDEVYDLAEAEIWTALTPYKNGRALLSNGNTYRYDRQLDRLKIEETTFSDCKEMAIRHFISLLSYDSARRVYDLSYTKKNIGPENQYFKNVEEFFTQQSPAFANAGDIDTRSRWNRAVGDLNVFDDSIHIDYIKNTNELNPGFINLIKIFQKIFELKLDTQPVSGLQAQKDWLEKALKTLSTTINPNRSYDFDLSDLTELNNDLSGNIKITVTDKKTEKNLFSFVFYSKPNLHSEIQSLKTFKKREGRDYNKDLKTHKVKIQPNTTEEAVWMVTSADMLESKLTHPLYKLFNTTLADNDSKVDFLEKIKANYESLEKEFLTTPDKLKTFKTILGNVLDEVSWDDHATLEKISPVVLDLAQEAALQDTLYTKVRGLKPKNFQQLETSRSFYRNLEHLNLEKISFSHNTFHINEFKKLKSLFLANISVKKIEGISALFQLESINFNKVRNLKELDVENLVELKKLYLTDIDIERIKGLKTLKKLNILNLNNANKLKEADLEGLTELKKLYVSNSNVERIKGLNALKNLEALHLSNVRFQERELDLENFIHLETLNLASSNFEKIKGFNTLVSLKSLDLFGAHLVKELEFTEDRKNLKINLKHSGIKNKNQIKGIEHLDENNITW